VNFGQGTVDILIKNLVWLKLAFSKAHLQYIWAHQQHKQPTSYSTNSTCKRISNRLPYCG